MIFVEDRVACFSLISFVDDWHIQTETITCAMKSHYEQEFVSTLLFFRTFLGVTATERLRIHQNSTKNVPVV